MKQTRTYPTGPAAAKYFDGPGIAEEDDEAGHGDEGWYDTGVCMVGMESARPCSRDGTPAPAPAAAESAPEAEAAETEADAWAARLTALFGSNANASNGLEPGAA